MCESVDSSPLRIEPNTDLCMLNRRDTVASLFFIFSSEWILALC